MKISHQTHGARETLMSSGQPRVWVILAAFALALSVGRPIVAAGDPSHLQPSAARVWDEQLLAAIRIDIPKPPAHARNLFHLSVAMWDAWAAYDPVAVGFLSHEKASASDVEA